MGALGIYNDERGGSGCGVFDVGSRKVRKATDTMALFMARQGTDWALARAGFLHTRRPSTGAVKVENSHPFIFGYVVGAHNGIVSNHEELNKKYDRKFEVDSMHIFAHLSEKRPLDDIRGYGAIEWWDGRDERLRLCFFAGGSLEVAEVRGFGIVWSSTQEHLRKAAEAAKIWGPTFRVSTFANDVYDVTDGTLEKCQRYKRLDFGTYTSSKRWEHGTGTGGSTCQAGVYPHTPNSATPSLSAYTDADLDDLEHMYSHRRRHGGYNGNHLPGFAQRGAPAGAAAGPSPVAPKTGGTVPGISLHDVTSGVVPEAVRVADPAPPAAPASSDPPAEKESPHDVILTEYATTYQNGVRMTAVSRTFRDGTRSTTFIPNPDPKAPEATLEESLEEYYARWTRKYGITPGANATAESLKAALDKDPAPAGEADAEEPDTVVDENPTILETEPTPEEIAAQRALEAEALDGLDPRSRWYPLADSGYYDHFMNAVAWVDLQAQKGVWDKEDTETMLDPMDAIYEFFSNASPEECMALNEIYSLRYEPPLAADDPRAVELGGVD